MALFRACRIAGGRFGLNLQADLIDWDPRGCPTGSNNFRAKDY